MNRTIQWLNANSHRRYPFIEDNSLVFAGGEVTNDVLLDFQFRSFVHPPAPIWLDNISASIDVGRAMTIVVMTFN